MSLQHLINRNIINVVFYIVCFHKSSKSGVYFIPATFGLATFQVLSNHRWLVAFGFRTEQQRDGAWTALISCWVRGGRRRDIGQT